MEDMPVVRIRCPRRHEQRRGGGVLGLANRSLGNARRKAVTHCFRILGNIEHQCRQGQAVHRRHHRVNRHSGRPQFTSRSPGYSSNRQFGSAIGRPACRMPQKSPCRRDEYNLPASSRCTMSAQGASDSGRALPASAWAPGKPHSAAISSISSALRSMSTSFDPQSEGTVARSAPAVPRDGPRIRRAPRRGGAGGLADHGSAPDRGG